MFVKQIDNGDGTKVCVNGWFAPPPSNKDYNDRTPKIRDILYGTALGKQPTPQIKAMLTATEDDIPKKLSLVNTQEMPARDQDGIGSCVSFGCVSLFEYHALKNDGKYTRLSELGLYKAMRNMMGWEGDTGAYVRCGMGAARAIGIIADRFWPYIPEKFEEEPPTWAQLIGKEYAGINYIRHDGGENTPPACALSNAKKYLASGFPFVFGFYGFPSFQHSGLIPIPGPDEQAIWSHCVSAFGYDDNLVIENPNTHEQTTGAILFRNSWGTAWGISGHGWLPYEYFLRRYAKDMWMILDAQWLDLDIYGLPQ